MAGWGPSPEEGYVHVTVFKGSSSRDCSIEFPKTGDGFLCVDEESAGENPPARPEGRTDGSGRGSSFSKALALTHASAPQRLLPRPSAVFDTVEQYAGKN